MKINETTRFYVSEYQLRDIREKFTQAGIFYILGSHSLFAPALKSKWVDRQMVSWWGDKRLLPGEIAKLELNRCFPDLARVGWYGPSVKLFSMRFPALALGEFRGEFIYFDLVAAYHQIYKHLWLDVGWPGGMGKLPMAPIAYALKDHKKARNSLIGLIRSRQVQGVKGEKRMTMATKNRYLSPHLWAVIISVLNEIAWVARDCGAVYCLVDGFFFPKGANWLKFQDFLNAHTFDYRRVETSGHILGWGSWAMDFRAPTAPYKRGLRGKVNHIKLYGGPDRCIAFLDRAKKVGLYESYAKDKNTNGNTSALPSAGGHVKDAEEARGNPLPTWVQSSLALNADDN